MEPYNPNKPTVSWKEAPKDKSELLDRLQEAGVPFTAALKYFYDNPEGPASETLNLATDETVPFKYQVRSGQATPASLAEEALLIAAPGPKKRGKYAVDEAATKRVNDWISNEINKEPKVSGNYTAGGVPVMNGYPMDSRGYRLSQLIKDKPQYTTMYLEDFPEVAEIRKNFPNEYNNIIVDQPAKYGPTGNQLGVLGDSKLSDNATVDNHFMPWISMSDGRMMGGPNIHGQQGGLQFKYGDYLNLIDDYSNKYKPYIDNARQIMDNPTLSDKDKQQLMRQLNSELRADYEINNLPD